MINLCYNWLYSRKFPCVTTVTITVDKTLTVNIAIHISITIVDLIWNNDNFDTPTRKQMSSTNSIRLQNSPLSKAQLYITFMYSHLKLWPLSMKVNILDHDALFSFYDKSRSLVELLPIWYQVRCIVYLKTPSSTDYCNSIFCTLCLLPSWLSGTLIATIFAAILIHNILYHDNICVNVLRGTYFYWICIWGFICSFRWFYAHDKGSGMDTAKRTVVNDTIIVIYDTVPSSNTNLFGILLFFQIQCSPWQYHTSLDWYISHSLFCCAMILNDVYDRNDTDFVLYSACPWIRQKHTMVNGVYHDPKPPILAWLIFRLKKIAFYL